MSESCWVIANALTTCSDETLRQFTARYFSTLVEPLANVINMVPVYDTKLVANIL